MWSYQWQVWSRWISTTENPVELVNAMAMLYLECIQNIAYFLTNAYKYVRLYILHFQFEGQRSITVIYYHNHGIEIKARSPNSGLGQGTTVHVICLYNSRIWIIQFSLETSISHICKNKIIMRMVTKNICVILTLEVTRDFEHSYTLFWKVQFAHGCAVILLLYNQWPMVFCPYFVELFHAMSTKPSRSSGVIWRHLILPTVFIE